MPYKATIPYSVITKHPCHCQCATLAGGVSDDVTSDPSRAQTNAQTKPTFQLSLCYKPIFPFCQFPTCLTDHPVERYFWAPGFYAAVAVVRQHKLPVIQMYFKVVWTFRRKIDDIYMIESILL